jgi:hypothetical protein
MGPLRFLAWAMRPDEISGAGQECVECRTVLSNEARFCGACGCNDLRPRVHSRFPYDAIAAFVGVMAVILYWLVRA